MGVILQCAMGDLAELRDATVVIDKPPMLIQTGIAYSIHATSKVKSIPQKCTENLSSNF